ncbi:MAG TPA: ATP-binding protein, partial [Chloroflexi bacterium]|nr:ATP-binding protein [Chloroflexota bacterium]
LEMRPVELDSLLLEVYRSACLMAQGVQVVLGHEDRAVVMGDPDRLKQLLLNLVDNALKYTPPGGQVTLSLYNEGEWVRVDVSDTGMGIPEEELPYVFERFYRGKNARRKRGAGLGLAIAKWIAEAHKGYLTVESEVGRGSTFSLWLRTAG